MDVVLCHSGSCARSCRQKCDGTRRQITFHLVAPGSRRGRLRSVVFGACALAALVQAHSAGALAPEALNRSRHVEQTGLTCVPGSADLAGLFTNYNEFERVHTIPREISWDANSSVGRDVIQSIKQAVEAYTTASTFIDASTSAGALVPHPLSVRGDSEAAAKWFSSLASAASRRANPGAGGDLVPRAFRGEIYPDILAGAVPKAWSAYYSKDQRSVQVALKELRADRERLATARGKSIVSSNAEEAARNEIALGLVDLHIGMISLAAGRSTQDLEKAAHSFSQAGSRLKVSCTPRFHALAKLGLLHAQSLRKPATGEMVLEAATELARIPPHENLPSYCAGGRHFIAVLETYLLGSTSRRSSNIEYSTLVKQFLQATCDI